MAANYNSYNIYCGRGETSWKSVSISSRLPVPSHWLISVTHLLSGFKKPNLIWFSKELNENGQILMYIFVNILIIASIWPHRNHYGMSFSCISNRLISIRYNNLKNSNDQRFEFTLQAFVTKFLQFLNDCCLLQFDVELVHLVQVH